MIKSLKKFVLSAIFGFGLLISCQNSKIKTSDETNTSGNIQMLVEESVSPIVNEELMVFSVDYPKAHIQLKYANEVALMNALMTDSATYKSAIIARDLTDQEKNFFISKKRNAQIRRFAIDGIALITNTSSTFDQISENEIYNVLKGNSNQYKFVFDNAGSSTIFNLIRKAKVDKLPKNGIFVLNGYKEVVHYIQEHPDYVGVVGLNWLLKNDTSGFSTPEKIKVLGVKDSVGNAYQPTQENLMKGLYPLRRELFIVNLKYGYGLGIGFASWLCSDRGQLLILKSGLAPIKEPARELRVISKNLNIK